MTLHTFVLAAAVAMTQAAEPAPDEPKEYSLVILKGDTARELALYADGRPVVLGEDKNGFGVALVLDLAGTDGQGLFVADPGEGPAYTSASRCVIKTGTVWLKTQAGFIDSGNFCSPKPINIESKSSYAGEDAPYLVIRRHPLSNEATRELLQFGIRSEALGATNKEGNLVEMMLNPTLVFSNWIQLACVSVAGSQVMCYKNPNQTQLCHKTTRYIYNKSSSCPYQNQPWVRQEGTYPCQCP